MSVVIRMKRTGRRNRPCYRISVADSRRPRDGRTLETLGLYDPVDPVKERQVTLNVESARRWLSQGALPSHTVRNIFTRAGVYEGLELPEKKRDRSGRKNETKRKARRQAAKAATTEAKDARRAARARRARRAAGRTPLAFHTWFEML